MRPLDVREKRRAGEAVHGILSPDCEPALVETLGLLGFSLYILDTEHGPAGPREAEAVARACEGAGILPLVRPRGPDPKLILQYLDAGMAGVMLPGVRSADDVRELVAAVKYPPAGRRGIAAVRANRWLLGPETQAAWVARSNAETLVLPQVETRLALGFPDGPAHPEVEAAIDRVAAVGRAKGLLVGTVAPTGARAKDLASRGLTILLHSVSALLRTGAEAYFRAARG
jgi:4-hydroxy-2-oxoheptanedioate aldolase